MCKFLILCAVALYISGCVTPYEQYNMWTGGGFDELQLSENSWKVSFKGTEFDDKDRIYDLCLLRCSELTINSGYKYFSVVTRENTSNVGSYTTPTITTPTYTTPTYTNQIGVGLGAFQSTSGGQTYGGQTYGGQNITTSSPRSSIEIVCYASKPANVHSYSAVYLKKTIKAKYQIN